ncbi:hypothetical protein J2805_002560 [Arthrobacter oryzae]|nr:hypothetical protein [Arthrobacter oryzae]
MEQPTINLVRGSDADNIADRIPSVPSPGML